MSIHFYNNLHRRLEAFSPADPANVTLYLCGPTVYNYVHIGNARGPVVFDVLVKLLRRHYPKITYARNITDVDDKINAAAKALDVPISAITEKYTAIYREDMAALGIQPPDIEPHATDHIPHIIAMIERLIAAGHAYAAEGHVLFAVDSYAGYGQLSRRSLDEMIAGARVEVAPYKRHPGDFVLWKPSTPDLPGWDSPWGVGRPGWHIECSAMSEAHLGETIDIHAGGVDLQFPHHENEIAQSTCAHGGKVFARFWLHNGMLNFGGSKMSKSVGNVSILHELLEQHPPEALRYALLSAHYRQPLDWSDGLIEQSVKTLDRLYGTLRDLADVEAVAGDIPPDVEAALCDDLNTPAAIAEIHEISKTAARETAKLHQVTKVKQNVEFALLRNQKILMLDAIAYFRHLGNAGVYPIEVAEKLITQVKLEPSPHDFFNIEIDDMHKRLMEVRCLLKSQLLAASATLGLLQKTPVNWFQREIKGNSNAIETDSDTAVSTGTILLSSEQIEKLITERNAAKQSKDFARSDEIRKQLADEGILLEDTPQGVRWKRA